MNVVSPERARLEHVKRWAPRLLVAQVLTVFQLVLAQPGGPQPDSVASLRDLLEGGYYALAAQVDGPQVVKAHPDSAEAHLLYAKALYLVGNLEDAGAALNRAAPLAPNPETARAIIHLEALIQAAQGDAVRAVRALERVYTAAPSYKVAMDWGQVAWQGGDLAAALRAYRAAATTPQGQREPWPTLNTARLLLLQGKADEAIAMLETTLTLLEADPSPQPSRPSPAYAEVFYRLGEAYEALGDAASAISNYQAALSVNPEFLLASEALERLESR